MYKGPEQGLCLIDDLLTREELDNYSLAYSARADLCRRLGRLPEARASDEKVRFPWLGRSRNAVSFRGGLRN